MGCSTANTSESSINLKSAKINFHYFNGNGRGTIIRSLLGYNKVEFKDMRYSFEDFGKSQSRFGYGMLPALEVNSRMFDQSHAIEMYLAKKYSLVGKTAEEEWLVSSILFSMEDYFGKIIATMSPKEGQDVEELVKTACVSLSKVFTQYETYYEENGKGKYFLGDRISAADFVIAYCVKSFILNEKAKDTFGSAISNAAPGLVKIGTSLLENELKEVYEKHWIVDGLF